MEVVMKIVGLVTQYMDVIISVVGVAALVATKTPNKSDDKIVQVILDLINFVGANIGEAKNTD